MGFITIQEQVLVAELGNGEGFSLFLLACSMIIRGMHTVQDKLLAHSQEISLQAVP